MAPLRSCLDSLAHGRAAVNVRAPQCRCNPRLGSAPSARPSCPPPREAPHLFISLRQWRLHTSKWPPELLFGESHLYLRFNEYIVDSILFHSGLLFLVHYFYYLYLPSPVSFAFRISGDPGPFQQGTWSISHSGCRLSSRRRGRAPSAFMTKSRKKVSKTVEP